MAHANANGITSVSDIPGEGALPIYQELADEGALTVRFALYPTMSVANIAATKASFKGREGWLEFKGVKVYMDGTLGSRTAWMFQPFNNNPADVANNTGLPRPGVTDGTVERTAAACAANGLQMIGHAIGDRANHELVEFFKGAWPDVRAARPRLEHAQHLLASDIPAIGRLGVVCSYQPFHKADDGRYCEGYIGLERSNSSYAYKDVLDNGGVVAFGSDWPVVTVNPFLGMEAAVTGRTLAGQLWQTRNNVPLTEALRGYTSSGAYAMFWDDRVGRITPGFAADFILLNETVFSPSPNWSQIRPVATYVGGKKVFGGQP
jgi:predicted amidohydrolase YtcJ